MSTKSAQKAVMDAKIPSSVEKGVEALAKGLGVAAIELWSIFVRQYIVKGLTQLLTGIIFLGVGIFLSFNVGYYSIIPMVISIPFFYGTIMLLVNPKYYAITDITNKIKEIK